MASSSMAAGAALGHAHGAGTHASPGDYALTLSTCLRRPSPGRLGRQPLLLADKPRFAPPAAREAGHRRPCATGRRRCEQFDPSLRASARPSHRGEREAVVTPAVQTLGGRGGRAAAAHLGPGRWPTVPLATRSSETFGCRHGWVAALVPPRLGFCARSPNPTTRPHTRGAVGWSGSVQGLSQAGAGRERRGERGGMRTGGRGVRES
jgi:hypothetical protein